MLKQENGALGAPFRFQPGLASQRRSAIGTQSRFSGPV